MNSITEWGVLIAIVVMVCDIICALLVCTALHKKYQKGTRPPDPRYLREGLAKKEHSYVASGIGNGVMESMKHYSLYFIALLPWIRPISMF